MARKLAGGRLPGNSSSPPERGSVTFSSSLDTARLQHSKLKALQDQLTRVENNRPSTASNQRRRELYQDYDYLRVSIEQALQSDDDSAEAKDLWKELQQALPECEDRLRLRPLREPGGDLLARLKRGVDIVYRGVAVIMYVAFLAMEVSIPLILLTLVEDVLVVLGMPPKYKLSNPLRSALSRWFLLLLGVSMEVEGLEPAYLDTPCLCMFTHGSNLDALLLSASFKRGLRPIVKKELFMTPYIGWIVVAWGGFPIDRRNREQAKQVMARAGEGARRRGDFLAVAPEGTRSKTGQLLPFKKGPFHMQEQLKWPVLAVVIMGAYELFPPQTALCYTGRVVLRYLKPIQPGDVKSREEMADRVRGIMLEASAHVPPEAGTEQSAVSRATNVLCLALTYWGLYLQGYWISVARQRLGISWWMMAAYFLLYSVLATVLLYVVYIKVIYRPRSAGVSSTGRYTEIADGDDDS